MAGASARLSEVRALSSGLRVSKHFLAPPKSADSQSAQLRLLFRSTPQARANLDLTVERVSDYVAAALTVLPPRHGLPEWLDAFSIEQESYSAARVLASTFRDAFFEGDMSSPIQELPLVLSNAPGVIIARIKESRFEGISILRNNYFFVFISPRFSGRMLFTLAHELGHILAHRDKLINPLMEGAASIGNFRKSIKSERFVDAFASCLLLPDQGVFQFLTVFRQQRGIPLNSPVGDIELLLLARFFGVSFDVAAHRCEDLKILPAGAAFSMSDHLRKNHKSPEKRAEELGLPGRETIEFPVLSSALSQELLRGIERGEISIGWASDHFGVSLSELLEMHRPGSDS